MNGDELHLPMSCPWCGRTNNRHQRIDDPGDPPEAGDVGLCWGCHRAFVFTGEGGQARKPTEAEAVEIAADADIMLALAAIRDSDIPTEAVAFGRSVLGRGS
jgi:hypothetical protein